MIRKQIYLEETMIKQIIEIAEKKGLSQSEVIRQSLANYIRDEQSKGKLKDPLLELIGLIDAPLTDGSLEHDKYIYGREFNE